MSERKGILAGGHFIVDRVKLIDRYPEEDQLALVQSEHRATGGGPYNILCVLSALRAGFKSYSNVTIPCETPRHEPDACYERPRG